MPVPKSVWIGLAVTVAVVTIVLIALYATDNLPGIEARRPDALESIPAPAGAARPRGPDMIDASMPLPAMVEPFSELEANLVDDMRTSWHGRYTTELRGATANVGDEPEEGIGSSFGGLGTIADHR